MYYIATTKLLILRFVIIEIRTTTLRDWKDHFVFRFLSIFGDCYRFLLGCHQVNTDIIKK